MRKTLREDEEERPSGFTGRALMLWDGTILTTGSRRFGHVNNNIRSKEIQQTFLDRYADDL